MSSDDFMYEPVPDWEDRIYEINALHTGIVGHFKRAQRITELVANGSVYQAEIEASHGSLPYQLYIELLVEYPLLPYWEERGIVRLTCEFVDKLVKGGRQIPDEYKEMIGLVEEHKNLVVEKNMLTQQREEMLREREEMLREIDQDE